MRYRCQGYTPRGSENNARRSWDSRDSWRSIPSRFSSTRPSCDSETSSLEGMFTHLSSHQLSLSAARRRLHWRVCSRIFVLVNSSYCDSYGCRQLSEKKLPRSCFQNSCKKVMQDENCENFDYFSVLLAKIFSSCILTFNFQFIVFALLFCRSNLLRLYILKVAQQTRKHHDKITSVDEFAKRIFSVIHSNDPVARALTLR